MSNLKFTLSGTTLLLPDDLSGLKLKYIYIYSDLQQSHEFSRNGQMQMVFTTEEFLEVATENCTYIYIYIYTLLYYYLTLLSNVVIWFFF